MTTMINRFQGRTEYRNSIENYLAALNTVVVFGLIATAFILATFVVFPQHIFLNGVVYAPSVTAAGISLSCFIVARISLKDHRLGTIPDWSTFFTILGLGFLILAAATCLLHSHIAGDFLAHHLKLLRVR